MLSEALSLAAIEPQLRRLLPADLFVAAWADSSAHLMSIFEHLRTLQHILNDYTPRQVLENPPCLGEVRYRWQQGTLLFTDLAGFTPLMEANAAQGNKGAAKLLDVLNQYFSAMVAIASKSGGDLLEFTGDAMLVQFMADAHQNDLAQAIRAGLRMQRAMASFADLVTEQGQFSLGMRIGIHTGRFLTADIGTPQRMAHVLLGKTVQQAKQAEGAGQVGRVCLSTAEIDRLGTQFRFEPCDVDHVLVKDDLTDEELGEYDIAPTRRRLASALLFDRSPVGLLTEITEIVRRVEPLASYLPTPILNVLVESAAQRQIPPNFPEAIVLFVNLRGFPESVDQASPQEVEGLNLCFSQAFALIDAAVLARGGILQKITYHLVGSDILIYFGVLNAHRDDAIRAAETALAIQEIVSQLYPPLVKGQPIAATCRIGMSYGSVFVAEIGEPRGRREFNILGDPVNTAARLMSQAEPNQILLTEAVQELVAKRFYCQDLGAIALKGKSQSMPVFTLSDRQQD